MIVCALLRAAPVIAQTASAPPVFAPKYLEQIALRYADAATVAKSLNAQKLPAGVTRLKVDAANAKAVQVLGTADGIATAKALIALIDVAPRQTTFRVFVERDQFAASGVRRAAPVARKTVTLTHNVPTRFEITDKHGATLAVSLTARLPQTPETPATLLASLGWRTATGSSVGLERGSLLPTGQAVVRVVGVTFADNPDFVGTVGVGNLPKKWQGKQTAYYILVQAVPSTSVPKE